MRDTLISIFVGAGMLLTTATALSDALWADTLFCTITDPKTNMTCQQIADNPGQDVYFIVGGSEDDNNDIFNKAIQDPDTVRWNEFHTKFIIKYNAKDVPRDQVGTLKPLNNPKTNAEILEIIRTPGSEWLFGDAVANDTDNLKSKNITTDDNYINQ